MADDNFGSTIRIFLKFCTKKGVERSMENILRVFLKKILFGANGQFKTQKWHTVITLNQLLGFF